jgi:negative regulator of genetic competence, sporulation and motility
VNTTSSTKFFEYVTGYSVPVVPKNSISEDEAKRRRAYYVVAFDDLGQIVQVTKMLDSQFEFQYDYHYDDAGHVTAATITGPDGKSEDIPVPEVERQRVRSRA